MRLGRKDRVHREIWPNLAEERVKSCQTPQELKQTYDNYVRFEDHMMEIYSYLFHSQSVFF